MDKPIQFITDCKEQILQTYRELHELAEPSWEEQRTSRYLQEKLSSAGLQVTSFAGHHGFIAEIPGEKEGVIALRADMDALVQEVNGEIIANHSCGHDGHSTMALYTALALKNSDMQLSHTIRFIFQPAEELAEGALQMMEEGALNDVLFLGGVHVRPHTEVPFGQAAPVILHGSSSTIKGVITGTPAHAARPEEGNNPIEAASMLIQSLQRIRLTGGKKFSIKMTELHSGETSNSVPASARFTLDIRAEANETMEALLEKAVHLLKSTAALTETKIDYETAGYSPAAIENAAAVRIARQAIRSVLGEENTAGPCISQGAEDFHFYTWKTPHIAATMIGLGCDLKPGLHHPQMSFNTDALIYGTKILTEMIIRADREMEADKQ
ncbi:MULTISPECIES: amidohydrolase [unclassified Sporosarcina]|uniref:amidohydrolase n=1 Tax=unclassified Sporosarcina TaxID=2647733 RepID=UPI00203B5F05|nr:MULTISPECIES: amidohydrolase [unclassified Sporosarcina]GKV64020.1 amidohydrolase AmhX [Sporosarcina sp. NCCP-2331]GLB56406.1 amidohydrolase AmhX [Sporosarcina sp. NCCP-2378]